MILPNLQKKIFQKGVALLLAVLLILPSLFVFIQSTSVASASTGTELLTSAWTLTGNRGAAEKTQIINSLVLAGKDTLQLTYNLHGLRLLGGDASAIILEQPRGSWHYVSLSNYGKNGYDGVQTVSIPLSAFPGLNLNQPVGTFHVRFWSSGAFTVDITSVQVTSSAVVPSPTPTPTTSPLPVPTPIPTVTPVQGAQLLTSSWNLSGNNGAVEKYQTVNPAILQGQSTLTLTYNLHGLSLLGNDASAVIFDQGGSWHYVSLSNYGKNGYDGVQTVSIPLSAFPGLNLNQPVGTFHVRFWSSGAFTVDITSVQVGGGVPASTPNPTPAPSSVPVPTATPAPVNSGGAWAIQSVSSMKETKDKICGQDSQAFINSWVDKAKELGANYVAVETPYENPACGNALTYTKAWVDTIRSRGLKVWHRHMPLAHEGIYNVAKARSDYFNTISGYIKNNPSLFAAGDIFTPIPEPQNGGISGVTGCANGVCQYDNAAHFNKWLRDAIDISESAFGSIGLGGKMKLGYYGFDGFVAWGSNNPDWNGILEDATVTKMGHIAIDHYPELIGQTMKQGLDEVQARYPGVPIVLSEWGSAGTGDIQQQVISSMGAAKRPGIVGFNYWHMGMGGNEALINSDFTNRPQFDEVQSYFKGTR